MKKIVIVGGGFAGLWSAFGAIRLARIHGVHDLVEVTLINRDGFHGLRPRYYENDLDDARVPLEKYLVPLGVSLIIGEVTELDHLTQQVTINHKSELLRRAIALIELATTAKADGHHLAITSKSHEVLREIVGI